jgi:hypothetical protein
MTEFERFALAVRLGFFSLMSLSVVMLVVTGA